MAQEYTEATATRDLQSMLANGAMVPLQTAGERSTKYQLNT
jgi:hypothetical protein